MRIFISYSQDTDEHIAWVIRLAESVRDLGMTVIFDQWSVGFGQDINRFMESSIDSADIVLVICTPEYVKKSDSRVGGVGYESVIISSELLRNQGAQKFIPIVRSKSQAIQPLPAFLRSRFYVDMTKGDGHGKEFTRLTKQLKNFRLNKTRQPAVESDKRAQLSLGSPQWIQPECSAYDSILDEVFMPGLVELDRKSWVELFGTGGFWYANASTGDTDVNYGLLARHLLLHIDAAIGTDALRFKALWVGIAAPMTLKMGDVNAVLNETSEVTHEATGVMLSTILGETGAKISFVYIT